MLTEFIGVRQIPGEGFRRWFHDDIFDLIVFYPSTLKEFIEGFQLCYRTNNEERVLSWNKGGGYQHNKIDDGEKEPYSSKMSPVLVKDGVFKSDDVLGLFLTSSLKIDPIIREEVKTHIQNLQFSIDVQDT